MNIALCKNNSMGCTSAEKSIVAANTDINLICSLLFSYAFRIDTFDGETDFLVALDAFVRVYFQLARVYGHDWDISPKTRSAVWWRDETAFLSHD